MKDTRALITAALTGKLDNVEYKQSRWFKVQIPLHCEGLSDQDILLPSKSWDTVEHFDENAKALANAFIENFKKYEDGADENLKKGAPNTSI